MLCLLARGQKFNFISRLCSFGIESSSNSSNAIHHFNAVVRDEIDVYRLVSELKLKQDKLTTSMLNELAGANVCNISATGNVTKETSLVQGITLKGVPLDDYSIHSSTIYIRNFYPALFECLMDKKYTVLTGNPGVSKSWYQWYILYCLINKGVKCKFTPKLIVRQVGESEVQFIFPPDPESGVVSFYTGKVQEGITTLRRSLQHDKVLFLVEPLNTLMEPDIVGVKTILTCSPDQRHYKEFVKLAAEKLYMPVWTLEELQLVGAHIRRHTTDDFVKNTLEEKQIKERFYRFGGIFRYVLPIRGVEDVKNLQERVLDHAKPVDTFLTGRNIEQMDYQKDNISHFLLQYNVVPDGSFQNFQMMYASEYVRWRIEEKRPNKYELQAAVHQLIRMFQRVIGKQPQLFEFIVYYGLRDFEWTVYCKKEEVWINRSFDFVDSVYLSKQDKKLLKEMKPFVLYRPFNPKFFGVEMLWVELHEQSKKEYFAIQVTFASSHAKSLETYQSLREHIGLKVEDKLTIYVVSDPHHLKTYANRPNESYISGATRLGVNVADLNIEFATITTKKFATVVKLDFNV